MRRFGWVLAALLCLACAAAWADEFSLPGLESDADAYASTLTAKFPAGGTPAARKQAEAAAAAAMKKPDWGAAVAAYERASAWATRRQTQWLALAQAQMRRTPPDANRALQAAWQNFSNVDAGAASAGAAADGRCAERAQPASAGDPGTGSCRGAHAGQQGNRAETR